MADALRKPCASGGGLCAQKKGTYAARAGGCCCGPDCTTAWKASPCHAGEEVGTVCDCPASFPTEDIYICSNAKCNGQTIPVRGTIFAGYDHTPNVKWCFTVFNMEGVDTLYELADIPPEATLIDTLNDDCVSSASGGCDSEFCLDRGQNARFVRPRRCNLEDQVSPWICARDIGDCHVQPVSWVDSVPPFGSHNECVHFIGGAVEEQFFDECPNPRALNWQATGPVKTCCGCESGCGQTSDIPANVNFEPGCSNICPVINPNPTKCCCSGGATPLITATATTHWRLDYFQWQTIDCNCSKPDPALPGLCSCVHRDSNGGVTPFTEPFVPDCYGNVTAGFVPLGFGCMSQCDVPDQVSRSLVGTKTWSCYGASTDVVNTYSYTFSPPSRVETFGGVMTIARVVDPECDPHCIDGFRKSNDKRVRSNNFASSGSFF